MGSVNLELQYRAGFTILLGMEMKHCPNSAGSPIHLQGSNAKEAKGRLIGGVNHHDETCSRLFVFDAKNISSVERAGLQPGRNGRF